MNGFPSNTRSLDERLAAAYEAERARLAAQIEQDCPQGDYAHPVFGVGRADRPCLVLIGEAPGSEEAASGCPFVGKAGRQLDELLAMASILRTDIYITNVVKYRPVVRSARSVRNRTPSVREVSASLPLLAFELEAIRPDVIATLGNTPLTAMLTLGNLPAGTIGALHGRMLPLTISGLHTALFPLYHPASCIYNRALTPVLEQDMRALGENLVKGL